MLTFKDAAVSDVDAVFLNDHDFAEEVEFMGEQRLAVVERNGVRFPDVDDDRRGVGMETLTLHISWHTAPAVLSPGLVVSFESERWHVLDAEPEMGMLIVTLYRETSA